MSIRYTDGDSIESTIGELVRKAADLRSHQAVAIDHYDAWPVRYHLTPERSNLMRPFRFDGLDVLELGAGMGAVSRYLAEQARDLTVVEGTQARFSVLGERLRDLSNWRGQVANIEDVRFATKFDVVCVVGVLEYSELYMHPPKGQSPFAYFLEKAAGFLKPGGALILAIENRLGMKYWSGSAEDHTARLFDGISGYPFSKSPRTFSRKELKGLLEGAGFSDISEYYPFPDYKIPTSILSKELVDQDPGLAAEIACQQEFRNYSGANVKYFPDGLALRNVAQAGLLSEFANSFLFVAGVPGSPIKTHLLQEASQALGWYYSNHRNVPTQTVFRNSSEGVTAEKAPLVAQELTRSFSSSATGAIRWEAGSKEKCATGLSLRACLLRAAYFEDWKLFLGLLKTFLRWSFARWETKGGLRGEALDAVYVNAALPAGFQPARDALPSDFVLFDNEWISESAVPKSWFVFRNVFNLIRDAGVLSNTEFDSFKGLYEKLCRDFEVVPAFEQDLEREAALQAATSNQPDFNRHFSNLSEIFERKIAPCAFPHNPSMEAAARTEASRFFAENRELHLRLGSLPHRLTSKIVTLSGKVPGLHRLLGFVFDPLYRLAKKTSRSLKNRSGWLVPVARKGGFDVAGPFDTGVSGFVDVECRGNFGAAQSAELQLRFRGDGESAVLKLPLPLKPKKASILLRDVGEIAGIRVAFSPPQSVDGFQIRARALSRPRAVARLFAGLLRHSLHDPANASTSLQEGIRHLQKGGFSHFRLWLKESSFRISVTQADLYAAWVEKYDVLSDQDRELILQKIRKLPFQPLISILMPTYNTDPRWLKAALDSVVGQLYPFWELCIADDASTDPRVKEVLETYRQRDPRIRVAYRPKNGHISAASNTALELVGGEFTALLDHDDELAPHALYMAVEELNRHPQTDLIYSDEDKIDTQGRRFSPHFKPEWNPELFLSLNLVTHLAVFRTSLLRKIGGFRLGYEGSQDYDLTLRVLENSGPARIRHIPHILYHWRAIPGSVALASGEKTYAHEAARKAIRSHLEREGIEAEVVEGFPPLHRVRYPLPDPLPEITAIVCTRDRKDLLEPLVQGLFEQTDYPSIKLIIVDNGSQEPQTLDYFAKLKTDPRIQILSYPGSFNFADMNNQAVGKSTSDFVLLLNNDLRVIEKNWLREMLSFAVRPEFGAVGAKLLYPDDTIQHAGVVLGIGGVADHVHRFYPRNHCGYFGRANVTQSVSAATAACLLLRKAVFEQVGGLDAEHLGVAYNDVDLCLKIREQGYRIAWTPFAELYHLESASRGTDQVGANRGRFLKEFQWMRERWGDTLDADPAYNPSLSLQKTDFSLAFPPRVTKPWLEPFQTQQDESVLTPPLVTGSVELDSVQ